MTTLRERQTEVTRLAIFDALAAIIAREGVAGFSVQAVADAAGVSHRTVYRHFPTREALLEGLGDHFNKFFSERLHRPDLSEFDADELPSIAEVGWQIFNDNEDYVTAYAMLIVGARIELPSRTGRTATFANMLSERLAHLSVDDAAAVNALIRTLASTVAWHHVREHIDGPATAAPRAVRWALETLLRELAQGGGPGRDDDEAAAR